MNIRQQQEQWERDYLSPYASLSAESRGRDREEPQCDIRPVYQRDRDRILHSKAFRRMKHKTQVFLAPTGDHYRTRLTHTLEVAQIARTIARALRMNEDLTEAIALGHDLGHTPFGHAGEAILNKLNPDGFTHFAQSVRVVEELEKNCRGLNLTWEVRNGIMNHGTSRMPETMEGKIVRFSDKIAYINHDIDDAIRGQIISEEDIPDVYTDVLGHTSKSRLNTLIHGIIGESIGKPDIIMPQEIEAAMLGLRRYMFDHVYTNPIAKGQEHKAQNLLRALFEHFMENYHELPVEYQEMGERTSASRERVVCDYIAGMTDQYAISVYEELYVPTAWKVF
ncbi:MAG TPA: deoxyguanosinetriphosphate triphosphohydrolase [Candidatus Onthocola gallistercoris]|uniref:Deoxyguanosinetriphosphate triphosphohydrolase-like protein n=1 Tax=Candidatus Onthocola gallistercoris TaxID=2840876 RepID=A0A9D1KXD0_9FIRM|nr:deoxyguanosinetriphosphate triphosphohydrolase [Candidatus Onthocola gallistercoris]